MFYRGACVSPGLQVCVKKEGGQEKSSGRGWHEQQHSRIEGEERESRTGVGVGRQEVSRQQRERKQVCSEVWCGVAGINGMFPGQ